MFRFPVASALLILALSPAARAQEAEDAWKKLVMQAIYLAGEKDYAKAEDTLQKALHEAARFGSADERVGSTLNTLGLVYAAENRFNDAEGAYRKALVILDKADGVDSLNVANENFNIAGALFNQNRHAEAVPYVQKALEGYERLLGGTSVKTAAVLCMLGDSYRLMKNYTAAEGPLKRCADIRESDGGMQNADLADAMYSLAMTYAGEGKYGMAEPRFKLTEKIRESTLGLTSPLLARTMEDHASVLKAMGRNKEADQLITLSSAIRRAEKRNK
jgi:tetratricopeptide (TPR) repeat protein